MIFSFGLLVYSSCTEKKPISSDLNEDDIINDSENWFDDCSIDTPEMRMIDVGDVQLHVACQGSGPTIVLLHGFPEFWYSWQKTMDELSMDYRLIAPDQRGYNLSDKPFGIRDYELSKLVGDIGALIDRVSEDPVVMVGHDWGGPVAWATSHEYPEKIRLMISANGPHPDVMADLLMNDSEQQEASGYIDWFVEEGTEEQLIGNDFAILSSWFRGVVSEDELLRYKEAWGMPDAIKSGLHWYRASFGADGMQMGATIEMPTLVLWGLDDTSLLPQQLDGLEDFVPNLEIVTYEGVSHWIEHEIPKEIAEEMRSFIESH
jgi:pimeloyl-ACP methyl ester carboxylesterase